LKDNYRLYDGNQRLIIAFEQIDKIFSPQAVNAVYEETRGIAFYKIYLKKVKVLRKEVQRLLTDKNEPLNILLKDIDEELSSCKESEVLLKRGLDKMISTFDKYNERITEARRHIAGNYLMMRMQEQD
jgi:hypothetical protein